MSNAASIYLSVVTLADKNVAKVEPVIAHAHTCSKGRARVRNTAANSRVCLRGRGLGGEKMSLSLSTKLSERLTPAKIRELAELIVKSERPQPTSAIVTPLLELVSCACLGCLAASLAT